MSRVLPSWARRGLKIVCVNAGYITAENGHSCHPHGDIQVGIVYTIRALAPRDPHGACVHLREVRTAFWPWQRTVPFLIERFQPAQENSGSLEIETALYHKKRRHQSAPAKPSVGA